MLSLSAQDTFRRFITPHLNQFTTEIKYDKPFDTDRITVWADTEMYKWKEDKIVFDQEKGKTPNIFQVFVDGIFICYFANHIPRKQTLREFWQGFLKAYSLPNDDPGKLFIDPEAYEDRDKQKKQKKKDEQEAIVKAIKSKPVKSEVQAQAKEIALDVVKSSPTT